MEGLVILPIVAYIAIIVFMVSLAIRAVAALERISKAVDRIATKP